MIENIPSIQKKIIIFLCFLLLLLLLKISSRFIFFYYFSLLLYRLLLWLSYSHKNNITFIFNFSANFPLFVVSVCETKLNQRIMEWNRIREDQIHWTIFSPFFLFLFFYSFFSTIINKLENKNWQKVIKSILVCWLNSNSLLYILEKSI